MKRRLLRDLSWTVFFVILFPASAIRGQTDLDLLAEKRVITYVRQHVQPGEFFLVTDMQKVFKTETEKRAIDRLYNIFFRIPLFVARYHRDAGRFPSLDEIARQFELQIPGEVEVLLMIFDCDPRAPKYFTRDADTGEITGMDLNAVGANVRSFGLEALDGEKTTSNERPRGGVAPVATRAVPCEKKGEVAIERSIARSFDRDSSNLEGTQYFYNRVDLNGDGEPEVLAYLRGPRTCSSNGCLLLVLQRDGNRYAVISRIYMAWSPVVVTANRSNGWSDLVLRVEASGGGAGRYRRIAFDGKSYRQEDALPLTEKVAGVFYMSDSHEVGAGISLPPHVADYETPGPGVN